MGFLKRPSIIVTILLFFLALQLQALRVGENREAGVLGRYILVVNRYPEQLITNAANSISGVWERYFDLVRVREENIMLREEVAGMRAELFKQWEAVLENERLRRLVGFKRFVDYPVLPANVLGSSPSIIRPSLVVIDVGTRDGVEVGMPVVTDEGVVGRVFSTVFNASEVVLITDGASSVDAFIHRTRARGIIKGTGGGCVMHYIEKETEVTIGDRVIATGKDGFYTKGLEIGTVYKVKTEGDEVRAFVLPSASLETLEEVLVILKPPVYSDRDE